MQRLTYEAVSADTYLKASAEACCDKLLGYSISEHISGDDVETLVIYLKRSQIVKVFAGSYPEYHTHVCVSSPLDSH